MNAIYLFNFATPESNWVTAYAPLIAILGTILVTSLTLIFTYRNQQKLKIAENRAKCYSEIIGKRFLLQQLYVTYLENHIYSDFHEILWVKAGSSANSTDYNEAMRFLKKCEDLTIDIAKAKQSLFESIGLALSSFKRTEELISQTEKIFRQPGVKVHPPNPNIDLEQWKIQAVAQSQTLVEREIAKPIISLTEYLLSELDSPIKLPWIYWGKAKSKLIQNEIPQIENK